MTTEFDDPDPPRADRATVLALCAVAVVAATALGAAVGYLVPARTGVETVRILEIAFSLSPTAVAAYAGVVTATFLATLALVLRAISQFDEQAV